jgi:hypothetical protein
MVSRNFDAKIHITEEIGTGITIIPGGTIRPITLMETITITAGMSLVRHIIITTTRAEPADSTGTIRVSVIGGGILKGAVHHHHRQR